MMYPELFCKIYYTIVKTYVVDFVHDHEGNVTNSGSPGPCLVGPPASSRTEFEKKIVFGQSSPWIYFNKNGTRFEFPVCRLFSRGPFLRQSSGKKQHLAK